MPLLLFLYYLLRTLLILRCCLYIFIIFCLSSFVKVNFSGCASLYFFASVLIVSSVNFGRFEIAWLLNVFNCASFGLSFVATGDVTGDTTTDGTFVVIFVVTCDTTILGTGDVTADTTFPL